MMSKLNSNCKVSLINSDARGTEYRPLFESKLKKGATTITILGSLSPSPQINRHFRIPAQAGIVAPAEALIPPSANCVKCLFAEPSSSSVCCNILAISG